MLYSLKISLHKSSGQAHAEDGDQCYPTSPNWDTHTSQQGNKKLTKDPPAATGLGRAWNAPRSLSRSLAKSRALWFKSKAVPAWGWFAGSARVALAEQTMPRNGWAEPSLMGRGMAQRDGSGKGRNDNKGYHAWMLCLPCWAPDQCQHYHSTAVLTQIQVRRRKRKRLEVMGDIWIISARLECNFILKSKI